MCFSGNMYEWKRKSETIQQKRTKRTEEATDLAPGVQRLHDFPNLGAVIVLHHGLCDGVLEWQVRAALPSKHSNK